MHCLVMRCIFCTNPVPASAPEHILLAALGGRRTTRKVICDPCNHLFGEGPDKALAESVAVIRNLMVFRSGRGSDAPEIVGPELADHQIILEPGALPRLGKGRPFKIEVLEDGRQSIQVLAGSSEKLRTLLPHVAAKLKVTLPDLEKIIVSGEAKQISQRIGANHYSLALGGELPIRLMLKSCLVLWAHAQGNGELLKPEYSVAKQLALQGGDTTRSGIVQIDYRRIGPDSELASRFGRRLNAIWISSDSKGQVLGYFRLYNLCGWRFELAPSGGIPDSTAGLLSDPSDPITWAEFSAPGELSFEWIGAAQADGNLEGPRKALQEMLSDYSRQAASSEIGAIFDGALDRLGFQADQSLSREQVDQLVHEVSSRIAHWALALPFEKVLSLEEIVALLESANRQDH